MHINHVIVIIKHLSTCSNLNSFSEYMSSSFVSDSLPNIDIYYQYLYKLTDLENLFQYRILKLEHEVAINKTQINTLAH